MKLLHIITGLSIGGAESMLVKLACHLQQRGIEQRVISLVDHGALGPVLERQGLTIDTLKMKRGVPSWGAFIRLRNEIRQYQPDVIQGWMYHANIAASLAASNGIPVIWGIRQSLYERTKERWGTRLTIAAGPLLAKRATRITYNSRTSAMQHEKRGYPANKTVFIPNGFDLERFMPDERARTEVRRELGIDSHSPVIGHIGRFHPVKQHRFMLRTFARTLEYEPGALLVMAGTGVSAENNVLKAWIQEEKLDNHVRLLGPRRDVARLMNAFDVYSSSSAGEGFPNVLGEAMACGVPCVTTDVGDSGDIVNGCGWVVGASSSSAFSNALLNAIKLSEPERIKLSFACREKIARDFSMQKVTDQYCELYRQVVRAA